MRKSNFGDLYQTAILAAAELSGEPSSATDPDEVERELGPAAAARACSTATPGVLSPLGRLIRLSESPIQTRCEDVGPTRSLGQ
jgi:hypothetical protein